MISMSQKYSECSHQLNLKVKSHKAEIHYRLIRNCKVCGACLGTSTSCSRMSTRNEQQSGLKKNLHCILCLSFQMYVNLLFWYQFFCGFSGAVMTNSWVLILFNLIFTSIPPLIYGVLDKDMASETLMELPKLYQNSKVTCTLDLNCMTVVNHLTFVSWFVAFVLKQ